MLRFFTGISSEKAEEICRKSRYDLKVALVMALADVEKDEARRSLKKSQGLIWKAIRLVQEKSRIRNGLLNPKVKTRKRP